MRQKAIGKKKKYFMDIARVLAEKGIGKTSPNPVVGAVIVKNGKIVGKGYHKKTGLAHAEINALKDAGLMANGADMYVTLEPCNHFGRTPPCVDAIITSGIKNVFVGMKDPNPLVAGKGIKRLRAVGIYVEQGILAHECKAINEQYIKYITTHTPFVTLKLASTLDGKIATSDGGSKWITGKTARIYVHSLRASADAVMVGIRTVLKDNPELTTRLVKGKDPVRIVVDSKLRIPFDAKVLNEKRGSIIIATTQQKGKNEEKCKKLKNMGAKILVLPSKSGRVDLKVLMNELYKMEITNLIIEGGATLAASSIKAGIIDKIVIFFAPKILGKEGLPMIEKLGIKRLQDAISLNRFECNKLGEDIIVQGFIS